MSNERKAELGASIEVDEGQEKVEGEEGDEAGREEEDAAEGDLNVTIPDQLNLDSLGDEEPEEDAMTVATSALDTGSVVASAVPTSYYSKRADTPRACRAVPLTARVWPRQHSQDSAAARWRARRPAASRAQATYPPRSAVWHRSTSDWR